MAGLLCTWRLIKAIKDVVEFLLVNGAKVTTREDRFGQTPLHDAAQYGHKDIAGLLIDYGTDVNVRDKFMWTPLHAAVAGGHKDMVELLIAKGAKINVKEKSGRTPLHVAAIEGHKELVKLLRKHGAKMGPEILDVVQQGDISRLELLLAENPKLVNAKDSYLSLSPLSWAAIEGHKEVAELLIAKGVDVNAKTTSQLYSSARKILRAKGSTPLHLAVVEGHKNVAELLIDKGADVNAKDITGVTPLHWAAVRGYKEIFVLLIAN